MFKLEIHSQSLELIRSSKIHKQLFHTTIQEYLVRLFTLKGLMSSVRCQGLVQDPPPKVNKY